MKTNVGELIPFTKRISGIYKIENKINGKVYVGQSVDVYRRLKKHIWEMKSNNSVLYKALQKYGTENFTYELIEECEIEKLDEREMYYISKYNSYVGSKNSNGYNLNMGGGVNRGWNPSEQNRNNFRNANLGGKSHFARKTICDGVVFDCAKDCAEYFNISYANIKDWLSGKNKMPFEWYQKGLRYLDKEMCDYDYQKPKNIKVSYNGKMYDSIRRFCNEEKINRNIIRRIQSGKMEVPEYLKEGNFQIINTENEN